MQTTDDVDAHVVVAQPLRPTVDVGVVVRTPRFRPDTVTLKPALNAALASEEKLTTGTATQTRSVRTLICLLRHKH